MKAILASVIIAIGFCFFFCIKKKVQNCLLDKKLNIKFALISVISTIFAEIQFFISFKRRYNPVVNDILSRLNLQLNGNVITVIATIFFVLLSSLAICSCLYIFYSKISDFAKRMISKLDKVDKTYMLTAFFLFSVLIIVSYILTYVFFGTQIYNGIKYDVIFTTDSGNLFETNCWLNIGADENDLRQPLFGLLSAPFTVFPYAISKVLFFVPNLYAFLLAIQQAFILIFSINLIVRMLNLSSISKAFSLTLLTVTFPTMLFALNLEQYIYALFWFVLCLHGLINKEKNSETLFIAATGGLITNSALYLLMIEKTTVKKNLIKLIKLIFYFLAVCFIFGRGCVITSAGSGISNLVSFSGKSVTFLQKIMQYTNFVFSCIVCPKTTMAESVQLAPSEGFNFIGIAIFAICAISFVLNMKNKFARVSIAWVAYSMVLLILLGWGSQENGMILYSLYFGWAFLSLLILLIEKLPKKLNIIKYIIYVSAIVFLAIYNFKGIIEIIKFGKEFYSLV